MNLVVLKSDIALPWKFSFKSFQWVSSVIFKCWKNTLLEIYEIQESISDEYFVTEQK